MPLWSIAGHRHLRRFAWKCGHQTIRAPKLDDAVAINQALGFSYGLLIAVAKHFESDEMPSIPGKGSILCHPENLPTDILYNTSEK
jgi:hypothetical protein